MAKNAWPVLSLIFSVFVFTPLVKACFLGFAEFFGVDKFSGLFPFFKAQNQK